MSQLMRRPRAAATRVGVEEGGEELLRVEAPTSELQRSQVQVHLSTFLSVLHHLPDPAFFSLYPEALGLVTAAGGRCGL